MNTTPTRTDFDTRNRTDENKQELETEQHRKTSETI
jgi:hypothetical protein